MKKGSVLLESAEFRSLNYRALLFQNPKNEISAYKLDEVESAFFEIDEALRNGYFAAGFISYEAGYAFEKKFQRKIEFRSLSELPLLWFGIFESPKKMDGLFENEESLYTEPIFPKLDLSYSQYSSQIGSIQESIRNGEVYQINFTSKYRFQCNNSFGLYKKLRKTQSAEYSAFLNCNGFEILSISPELFFKVENRHILTKPMKGTAPRANTPAGDDLIINWLQSDEKNRAENLMILDLLRNDLGKICDTGSIQVPEIFKVETMQTVHQMTSTVIGTLARETTPLKIFRALFPSGSITGAPKVKAMELIANLETEERGLYCGSIGYFAPSQSLETDETSKSESSQSFSKAVFNVAIRTVVCKDGSAEMGVGSGITIDSVAEEEFEECKLKAKFLTSEFKPFLLIETMRLDSEAQHLRPYFYESLPIIETNSLKAIPLLEFHLQRLKDSAYYFGFHFDYQKIVDSIKKKIEARNPIIPSKLRLLLSQNGECSIELSPLTIEVHSQKRVCFAKRRIDRNNVFFYHKTTNRILYNETYEKLQETNFWDAIFFNEKDEVTETCIGNIIIKNGNEFKTPPIQCGLLNGVFRDFFLKVEPRCKESILTKQDILTAEICYVANSIRGLNEVVISDVEI
ncbi:MAG: aminodeoxychorismate synthase component I [Chloroherpetonaceae bacterium]|nr:aminodeoxychorismate synthase component I [Chloroherpetonaceae bacterium]